MFRPWLSPLELRLALLQEGRGAFQEVLAVAEDALRVALEVELLVERIVVGRGERKTGTRLAGWRGTVTKRVAQHASCSVFVAATGPHEAKQTQESAGGEHKRQGG